MGICQSYQSSLFDHDVCHLHMYSEQTSVILCFVTMRSGLSIRLVYLYMHIHELGYHYMCTCSKQEMMCNAVLCELIERKGVTKETFKTNHPGGNIGKRLNHTL